MARRDPHPAQCAMDRTSTTALQGGTLALVHTFFLGSFLERTASVGSSRVVYLGVGKLCWQIVYVFGPRNARTFPSLVAVGTAFRNFVRR